MPVYATASLPTSTRAFRGMSGDASRVFIISRPAIAFSSLVSDSAISTSSSQVKKSADGDPS
jgi:hypothetical protein